MNGGAVKILGACLLVIVASLARTPVAASGATCADLIGPGIPPPNGVTFGYEGFHAAWYGQSGYMSLCPSSSGATATVAYFNTGSRGWVAGRLGEVAYLGTWNPVPGQDKASILGGDGTNGSPATGWPRFNRVAVQPASYVGPGQVAWFQFKVRAPSTPGRYVLALRPLIEGAQWMEDYGVFWVVTVLNPDGTPPPSPVTFGDGTKIVGTDVPAGTYRIRQARSGCYWERLSGFSGAFGDIIANGFTSNLTIVSIAPTDRGFRTSGCGTWTNDLSPVTSGPAQPFGAGRFIVGADIAPGTWRGAGGSGCYWERLAGFSGESKDIRANGFGDVSPVVTIAVDDRGFASSGCGNWTKIA